MLKNRDIICISSIDWDFVWQGHQEIMAAFARNNNRVLFIENTGVRKAALKDIPRLHKRIKNWFKTVHGFREEMKNMYIYSPLALPFPNSRIARWINKYITLRPLKRWLKVMNFQQSIIWTFLPTGIVLDIVNSIEYKLLVYYCIADFNELSDNPKMINRTEEELLKACDLVFVQGKAMEDRSRKYNKNVYVFPFGVNIDNFKNIQMLNINIPEDIKRIAYPIIGYIGGVHRHIDLELIKFLARKHPEWSLLFVGPLQMDISDTLVFKNIYFLGKKDFSLLSRYIVRFDAAIIPYVLSKYTVTVLPTKLNEYHIMGKPVISTDLPEIEAFNRNNENLVFIGKTYEEFENGIIHSLNTNNGDVEKRRILSARQNNWAVRIEKMSRLLEEMIDRKTQATVNWQIKFIKLYRIWSNQLVKLVIFIIVSFFLFFYTNLFWFIAEPLKVSQPLHRVEAIVVFAGGVGESGKPGQGYEERVKYAVELYKKGYARKIIFSSGSAYLFKEAEVMKLLAVSMGVSEDEIILEEESKNTYENVKFVKEILDNGRVNSILLISSPYHMRRALLVFDKIAKNLRVVYAPVPYSLFYAHPEKDLHGKRIRQRINLQQVNGIIHEYLSILYYWWKRWI